MKYTRDFILELKDSEECKIKSRFLEKYELKLTNKKTKHNDRWEKGVKLSKNELHTEPIKRIENAWKPSIVVEKPDIKRITGILNKLSVNNKDNLLKETQSIAYTDPEVVSIIFKKAVSEPFYSQLYAQFCYGLTKLHEFIKIMCVDEFNKLKNKNLCKFIGELYKLNLISDLESFVNVLKCDLSKDTVAKELKEKNIEILCELIITVNPQHDEFSSIINELYISKNTYSPKYKFMIMDVYEYKNGIRVLKKN